MAELWRPHDSRLSRFFRDIGWKKWSVSSFLIENDASSEKLDELYKRFRDDMTVLSEAAVDAPTEVKEFIERLSGDAAQVTFITEFHICSTRPTAQNAEASAPPKLKKIPTTVKGKGKATALDSPTEDKTDEDDSDLMSKSSRRKWRGLTRMGFGSSSRGDTWKTSLWRLPGRCSIFTFSTL
ncbi:MAG: hypothetical protein J3Q66DRAFT_142891 [Benniella sp.]|nr:MAG: hypothetical protein J3Q66DRAFT_142891 [Benniella sp.]